MRTTLNTIYAKINTNLGKITTGMSKINDQISSGQQMSKLSEEPVNLVSALRFRSSIVELDQYATNIQHGTTILTSAESSLTHMKELSLRAKTLALQATDPAYTQANREAIAEEIKNIFEQAVYLANTQVNGKYIFGGFRTTGYTAQEPTPFIIDKGDGYWINGSPPQAMASAMTSGTIQSATTTTDLIPNDLMINGIDIGAVDLTVDLNADTVPDDTFGINMAGASNLKDAINLHVGLYAGSAATADTLNGIDSKFQFNLNGIPINVTIPDNSTATAVSNSVITAINLQTAETGVTALLGDGTNGGPADSVVFTNAQAGDNSPITVTDFTTTQAGGAGLGFTDFSQKIVTATLTTQASGITSAGATGGEIVDFSINGVRIAYNATAGGTAVAAQEAVSAINAAASTTGVTAKLGSGTNGGPVNAVVLQNTLVGDETPITVAGIFSAGVPLPHAAPYDEAEITGLSNGTFAVGQTNNTGKISLSSSTSISINTSSATSTLIPKDTILNRIGLGGGGIGNFDAANDGTLVYGYPLTAGELKINGIATPAPQSDGISNIYADASAKAKASAINSIQAQTGVTAVITNAETQARSAVTAGTEPQRPTGLVTNTVIRPGSLAINGTALTTEISGGAIINGLNMTKAANAKSSINFESLTTQVTGRLTTLLPNNTAATSGATSNVTFKINGIDIDLITGGTSGNKTATDVVAAINAVKKQTGVEARVGDGANGGVSNAIVLFNTNKGDEQTISVSGLNSPAEDFLGLSNLVQGADATHNTGEISLDSPNLITITNPTTSPGADTVLNELGFSSKNVTGFGGSTSITSTVTGVSITAPNSLYVNGKVAGDIIGGAPTNGVNMDMASSAKTQIEAADPSVKVKLTTMTQGTGATTDATLDSEIQFLLNGTPVTVTYPNTALAADIASSTVLAINAVSFETGVQAYVGTGAADGSPEGSAAANFIVFKNRTPGNEDDIVIAGMQVKQGNNNLGFTDFSQGVDATHNSGEISISSATTFDLSTPTVANDSVLNRLGLGFGASTGYSEKDDGLFYSTDGTGEGIASFGSSPAFMGTGDLIINGHDIFATPTAVLKNDQTNTLIDAINTKTSATGIQATRGIDGVIRLAAIDGRNIHIKTSTNGEAITNLTGGSRDMVSFGSLQLRSDRQFILETVPPAVNTDEPGLATLGLAGGKAVTNEDNDVAGDGKINVFSIHSQTGSVRYAGDRVNDMEVKIGKTSTLTIGANGKSGVMDTTIFSTLKSLQNYLLGSNFTTVTGIHKATDITAPLNSKSTGLEPASLLPTENLFAKGSFNVIVTDRDYTPPRQTSVEVGVDPAVDTLESVTKRINGIPRLSATWTASGQLKIESSDPDRYTISMDDKGSNFLEATGVSHNFMQTQGIFQSISTLDTLMENLTRQISDFGAKANRIDIQSQIYSTLTISTKENLSEVQDTDMIKAVMDLKAKETAYQAALSAAAKTMQLSLVDYLR